MTELSSLQLLPSLHKPTQTLQELDRIIKLVYGYLNWELNKCFYETEMMSYQ